ncbi:MAG: Ig-like domain-containing protein, partial [Planctomycetota bacterium]
MVPAPQASVATGVSVIEFQFESIIDEGTHWGPLFQLTAAGGDGRFDNGNENRIPLVFSNWNAGTRTMKLTTSTMLPRDVYRLVATDALVDPDGNRLDGEFTGQFPSGNGTGGGQFVSEFTVTNTPPIVDRFRGSTSQLNALPIDFVARDADGADVPLSLRIVQPPQHGTLTPGTGPLNLVYTPDRTFAGVDRFQIAASDGMAEGPAIESSIVVGAAPVDFQPVSGSVANSTVVVPGTPSDVSWTFRNAGPGATVAHTGGDWADEVFFSLDNTLDGTDQRLATVAIDSAAIGVNGTYTQTRSVTLPSTEHSGAAFLIVRSNADGQQFETTRGNNDLVLSVNVLPSVQLLTSAGSFLGRNSEFPVTWTDADRQGSSTISIIIDADNDPRNGIGQTVLATGLVEDPDGPGDRALVRLPAGVASGDYFLSARMESSAGPVFSSPVAVKVFAEAFPSDDSGSEATGGGSYSVFGVDLAQEGGAFTYRIRTNYNPLSNGGDVYVNIGGSYKTGGGRLVGISVRDRTTENGQRTTTGTVYRDVPFRGGTSNAENPIFVRSFSPNATGTSTVRVEDRGANRATPWRYEIIGTVSREQIGARPEESVEVGWGMYCGNDFSATDNNKPRLNLMGAGFRIENDPGANQASPPRRWGQEVTIKYSVVNQGNEDVGASTVRFVASSDSTIQLNDLALT